LTEDVKNMETKYWIGITLIVCLIEIWMAYIGYLILEKPPMTDGFYWPAIVTVGATVLGLGGIAAWDD